MTDLDELIARLEAASEGSRELDKSIAITVGTYQAPDRGDPYGSWLRYTSSLDAALTLVPEFCFVKTSPRGATAGCNGHICATTAATAPTPALALCIAALKARRPRAMTVAAEPAAWREVDADAPVIVRGVAESWEPLPGESRFTVFYGYGGTLYCLVAKGGRKSDRPKMWIELPFPA